MEAKEFYRKRLEEDPTIGSVQLMEEYAKYIIQDNFCDGSPIVFGECTLEQIEQMHETINRLIGWVNE